MGDLILIGGIILLTLFGGFWVVQNRDRKKTKRENITRHRIRKQY